MAYILSEFCNQIEALKAIGVTEVILAINYQPEVKSLHFLFTQTSFISNFVIIAAKFWMPIST